MNELAEMIGKATYHAAMTGQYVLAAFKAANAVERPEGRNLHDKALQACLSDLLTAARAVEAKLNQLR